MQRALADAATDAFERADTDCAAGEADLSKLANGGSSEAQLGLGVFYAPQMRALFGNKNKSGQQCPDFKPDTTMAVRWLTSSAKGGNGDAAAILGRMYEVGDGVQKDQSQMAAWYQKGATLGSSDAQSKLLVLYSIGALPVPTDRASIKWLLESKATPKVLGMMYEKGMNIGNNPQLALLAYEGAADASDPKGAFDAGMLLFTGKGVSADAATADKYLTQAAQAGRADAQQQIAYAYEQGVGVAADPAQAFTWYLKAAQQGQTYAEAKVADDLANGTGVAEDDKTAVDWAKMAARAGSAEGEWVLGSEYLSGNGIAIDKSVGVQWIKQALEQGYAPKTWPHPRSNPSDSNPVADSQTPTTGQALGALAVLGILAAVGTSSHAGSSGGSGYSAPPPSDDSSIQQQEQWQQQQDEADQQRQQEIEEQDAEHNAEQQQEMQSYDAEHNVGD